MRRARNDPYVNRMLTGEDFDFHCHSNLVREEREFAFDHHSNVQLYREYLAGGLALPVFG